MDHDRVNNNNKSNCDQKSPATDSHHHQVQVVSTFWRANSRALPGRPSLTNQSPMANSSSNKQMGSSFQTYQDSVSDAWDLGDDEFCIISSDTRISRRVAQSAAMNVIKTHRSSLGNNSTQSPATINYNHSSRVTNTSTGADGGTSKRDQGPSANNNNDASVAERSSSSTDQSPPPPTTDQ